MKKKMIIMLICLGILFGGILIYKMFIGFMIKRFMKANQNPPVVVSTMKVGYQSWQPELIATGSARAIRGVNVTTELAGMVQTIYFNPGSIVKQNDILVQLNADSDIALLRSVEAQEALAKVNYERDKAQYAIHAVSKAVLDTDAANLKSLHAQVNQQAAIVAKKTIRAPFSGRLGISYVNPGQYVNPGDKVVTLQTLDPIWVDFYMPQQNLSQLKLNQTAAVTTDTYTGKKFIGQITTIDPSVDPVTRNVQVEATIANPTGKLYPGMFVNVAVTVGAEQRYLTLPQTAIAFNPYGEIVYVVHPKKDEKGQEGKPMLIVHQAFVVTGTTRGDQVTILKGLTEGEEVVTSGQLKLKNGSKIIINNTVQLPDNPHPVLPDEH